MREKHKDVLVLDCGNSFSSLRNFPELRAEISIEGMNLMSYDALNIADGELSLGLELFEKLKQEARFPLLSANIYQKDSDMPLGQEFLIKESGSLRVGIVGLASPDSMKSNTLVKDSLIIKDPELTMRKLLPKIQPKVDLIILLSHLGEDATRALVSNVPGIHVAVVGRDFRVLHQAAVVGKTILIQNSLRGRHLGILSLSFDGNLSIAGYENSVVNLVKTTPTDPAVQDLERKFKEERSAIISKKAAEKKQREFAEQYKEQLKLTPEEFFEKMKKKNKLMTPEQFPQVKEKE